MGDKGAMRLLASLVQRTNIEVLNLESNSGIGFKTANLCLQIL